MRTLTLVFLAGSLVYVTGCQKPAATDEPRAARAADSRPEDTKATAESGSRNADETPRPESAEPSNAVTAAPVKHASAPVAKSETDGSETTSQKTASAEQEPASAATTTTLTQAKTKEPEPASADKAAAASGKGYKTKAEILSSLEFRRAIFEFNEWLTAQPIYTPQQVAKIKDQFNHRVAEMNAEELTYLLADLEAKMQVINSPDAKEARAWMAQYLSVMSDKKRAEVLKDVPNVATMTAAQLSAEIAKIEEKRSTMDNEQAAFQRGQASQVANQIQTDRINQQNYVRDWNTGPVSYSPYTNGSNVNQRLNNTPIGSGMTFYTGGWGGVGVAFSPSSW